MLTKPRKPLDHEFSVAIDWLENNEGDGGEGEACRAVAAWIAYQHAADMMRSTARKHRVPVAALKRKLEANRKAKGD